MCSTTPLSNTHIHACTHQRHEETVVISYVISFCYDGANFVISLIRLGILAHWSIIYLDSYVQSSNILYHIQQRRYFLICVLECGLVLFKSRAIMSCRSMLLKYYSSSTNQ